MNIYTFCEARLIAQQTLQLGVQRTRQRVGKSRQQYTGIGMRTRQISSTVQGDDGLACASRAGNSRRAGVIAFHPLPLFGVQEDRPFFPRKIERALQLVHVGHHAEAALCIGVVERIRRRHNRLRCAGLAARRQFQQRLRCFGRQMVAQCQQRVLGRLLHIVQPFGGHAVAEQLIISSVGE